MRSVYFLLAALFWMAVMPSSSSWAAAKPKFTIKQVMKESIKGHSALVKKACKGTATSEDLARMITYFRAMTECSPPQGDMDSWKAKSGALLQAALAVQKSPQDKTAALALENAVECRQCHNPHKPSKD